MLSEVTATQVTPFLHMSQIEATTPSGFNREHFLEMVPVDAVGDGHGKQSGPPEQAPEKKLPVIEPTSAENANDEYRT